MKLKILFLLTMSTVITYSSLSQNMIELLPDSPSGWKVQGEDKIYDIESLYDYIDGGAELYISYGMKNVVSRLITNNNGDEIRIEIFDMMYAKNAFGVFSHTRTKDEGVFGQGSQFFPGTQIFWKGQYYVSIMATYENENIKSAINKLSSQIDSKIPTTGEIPEIIKLLPEENLEKDAFMYFHHYIWLNSYYFIADNNFLGIDESTNALLAKYGDNINRYYLLVVEYADAGKAKAAYSDFKEKFLDPQTESSSVQIEDEKWLGGTTSNKYLICVFNASSQKEVDDLISKTISKTQP